MGRMGSCRTSNGRHIGRNIRRQRETIKLGNWLVDKGLRAS
jgi:hypothetical protein